MDYFGLRNLFNNIILITPEVEMAIWEPCNYVSNLAYDRLLVEMCDCSECNDCSETLKSKDD